MPCLINIPTTALTTLIDKVVCLSCSAAGPLVRYRGQWMAAYRAAVPQEMSHMPCHTRMPSSHWQLRARFL